MSLKLLVPTLAAGALLAVPATAGAAAVEPVYLPGHPSCAERGYDHEIKFYPAYSGTRTADGVTVDLTVDHGVAWKASKPVGAVIVSSQESSYAYEYPAGSAGDYDLRAPGGKYYKLHKVRVCWNDETPAPPPPVETPAPPPPAETPAPPAPPVVVAAPAAPAPAPAVVPQARAAVQPSSRLTGPAGCAGRLVKATVTGQGIVKTTFRLDGRTVKTVAGPGSFRVRTATLRAGVHRIKARVELAGARPRTHVVSFQRCIVKRIAPRFAG
jgi:hypothetical protein